MNLKIFPLHNNAETWILNMHLLKDTVELCLFFSLTKPWQFETVA